MKTGSPLGPPTPASNIKNNRWSSGMQLGDGGVLIYFALSLLGSNSDTHRASLHLFLFTFYSSGFPCRVLVNCFKRDCSGIQLQLGCSILILLSPRVVKGFCLMGLLQRGLFCVGFFLAALLQFAALPSSPQAEQIRARGKAIAYSVQIQLLTANEPVLSISLYNVSEWWSHFAVNASNLFRAGNRNCCTRHRYSKLLFQMI